MGIRFCGWLDIFHLSGQRVYARSIIRKWINFISTEPVSFAVDMFEYTMHHTESMTYYNARSP